MFMYPRLLLARDLLKDDGVIFISIDNNENSNLKLLCDEIFGETCCMGIISNTNNPKGRSDDKFLATAHEYILVYSKSIDNVKWYGFEPTDVITKRYNKVDPAGNKYREIDLRKTGENDLREDRENLFYYFYYNENNNDFYPSRKSEIPNNYIQIKPQREDGKEGNWRWGIETAIEKISELTPKFMPSRKVWGVMQKDFLEGRSLIKPTTSWTFKDINSERGTEEFTELNFDKRIFPKPKPVGTIKRCIELSSKNDDDIFIDFFSGSGTSAQSILMQNNDDDIKRKYILIQLPEMVKVKSEAEKAGYKTIDQIGMERIVRAAKKIKEENPETTVDLGFKHYTLQEVSENTLDKLEKFDPSMMFVDDTIYNIFGANTILATWLVHDGYGFINDMQTISIGEYTAYWCKNHLYLINPNFSESTIKALIEKYNADGAFNPQNVVVFGYSFDFVNMESLKINLKILKDSEKNLKINLDIRY